MLRHKPPCEVSDRGRRAVGATSVVSNWFITDGSCRGARCVPLERTLPYLLLAPRMPGAVVSVVLQNGDAIPDLHHNGVVWDIANSHPWNIMLKQIGHAVKITCFPNCCICFYKNASFRISRSERAIILQLRIKLLCVASIKIITR